MTEPLTAQISRALNPLLLVGGTRNASIGSQRLSHRYMHEWTTFTAEVNDILARLDLTGNISLTDPAPGEGDRYIVANELGLTSRFVANVALPLNKAYSLTTQGTLMFGDVQADSSISSSLFPDASILYMQDNECEVRAVGELKTYWTFPLERHPISSTIPGRRMGLEPHIGL